jgi:8-oxo-dGTP diphosphatase
MRCLSEGTEEQVNEVLMLKRVGPHGAGTWSFPGGHLDWGESSEEAVLREIYEEIHITIKDIFRGPYVEDVHQEEHKHMVTLYFCAWLPEGQEPILAEPHKHSEMRWVEWGKWPKPLFRPVQTMLKFHPDKWWDRRGSSKD